MILGAFIVASILNRFFPVLPSSHTFQMALVCWPYSLGGIRTAHSFSSFVRVFLYWPDVSLFFPWRLFHLLLFVSPPLGCPDPFPSGLLYLFRFWFFSQSCFSPFPFFLSLSYFTAHRLLLFFLELGNSPDAPFFFSPPPLPLYPRFFSCCSLFLTKVSPPSGIFPPLAVSFFSHPWFFHR